MTEPTDLISTSVEVGAKGKDVPWYSKELENVGPGATELLEKYSKIPSDQIVSHVLELVSFFTPIKTHSPIISHR